MDNDLKGTSLLVMVIFGAIFLFAYMLHILEFAP